MTTMPEYAQRVASVLSRAARHGRLVSYQEFHQIFAPVEPLNARYEALHAAVATLAGSEQIDYGCLLATANRLPGDDFFKRFQRERGEEYMAVMGVWATGKSMAKRKLLANQERARVYQHARRQRTQSIPTFGP